MGEGTALHGLLPYCIGAACVLEASAYKSSVAGVRLLRRACPASDPVACGETVVVVHKALRYALRLYR